MLVKLLKWFTGSAANTYHCKYAWDDVLARRHSERITEISDMEVGLLLFEVIQHRAIRGKFNSVHPDLRAKGVTRVDFDDQGIIFHQESSRGIFSCPSSSISTLHIFYTE